MPCLLCLTRRIQFKSASNLPKHLGLRQLTGRTTKQKGVAAPRCEANRKSLTLFFKHTHHARMTNHWANASKQDGHDQLSRSQKLNREWKNDPEMFTRNLPSTTCKVFCGQKRKQHTSADTSWSTHPGAEFPLWTAMQCAEWQQHSRTSHSRTELDDKPESCSQFNKCKGIIELTKKISLLWCSIHWKRKKRIFSDYTASYLQHYQQQQQDKVLVLQKHTAATLEKH